MHAGMYAVLRFAHLFMGTSLSACVPVCYVWLTCLCYSVYMQINRFVDILDC